MSPADDRFERLVSEMLEDAAPTHPPSGLVAEAERAVDATWRWPGLWAALREPPMRYRSGVAVGSPTARWMVVMAATMLLVLATLGAGIVGVNLLSQPAIIVVDQTGDGDVTTIARAVAIAGDGDEIHVLPGTYIESVVLGKDVTIVGVGPHDTIIWSAPDDGPTRQVGPTQGRPYALLLEDTKAKLSGLTFEGSASAIHIDGGAPVLDQLVLGGVGEPQTSPTEGSGFFADAIAVTGSSRALIRGSVLKASGAIAIHDGAAPLVEDNELVDGPSIMAMEPGAGTVVRGNDITGSLDRAIGVFGPGSITIEGNLVTGSGGAGISVGYSGSEGIDPILRDNTIVGARIGIDVASGAAPTIEGNTIRGSGTGISAGLKTDDLVATGNRLRDNQLGIVVLTSSSHFESNEIRGGTTGIVVANGGQPTFIDNEVQGAERAGFTTDDRSTPALIGNRICSRGDPVVVDGEASHEFDAANDICEGSGATIVVDQAGGGDVTTISEAVAMAEDGDEIVVRPGRYEEAVIVDKDVAIIGDGSRAEIVWTAPDGGPLNRDAGAFDWPYALLLDHVAATVRSVTFQGVSSSVHIAGGDSALTDVTLSGVGRSHTIELGLGQFPDAVLIYERAKASVANSTIQRGGPISAYEDTVAIIEDNVVSGGSSIHLHVPADGTIVRGNSVSGARVRAIGVFGPNRALIEGNVIDGSGTDGIVVGVGVDPGNEPIVRDNVISGAFTGIATTEGAEPEIADNTLFDNELGIWLANGVDGLRALGNTLTDNDIGIRVLGGRGLVEDNDVVGGETGVQLVWDAAPALIGNDIERVTGAGLSIDSSSTGTITDNRICANATDLDVAPELETDIRDANDVCEDAVTE